MSFPDLAVPFQVCSQCFIEWSLPCFLVLRNIGVLSSSFSFFFNETYEQVQCDAQCDMVPGGEPTDLREEKQMDVQASSGHWTRTLVYHRCARLSNCDHGST